jgi:hypothetical protein
MSSDDPKFLSEFEAILEPALARESGPGGGIVWWKTPRIENLESAPLNTVNGINKWWCR